VLDWFKVEGATKLYVIDYVKISGAEIDPVYSVTDRDVPVECGDGCATLTGKVEYLNAFVRMDSYCDRPLDIVREQSETRYGLVKDKRIGAGQ
jgi:hypothetical protein